MAQNNRGRGRGDGSEMRAERVEAQINGVDYSGEFRF